MARKNSRIPYFVAALGALTVILLAWINRGRFEPPVVGADAPDFTYPTLDGDPVTLSDFEGSKVVLVNVWATWCAPCRYEMPSMQALYREFGDEAFEILAVSIDARLGETDAMGRPGGDMRAFADSLGLTFPLLHNPSGDIQELYRTTGVPETFLVGKDGVIYKKVTGGADWHTPQNRELVRRLIAEAGEGEPQ